MKIKLTSGQIKQALRPRDYWKQRVGLQSYTLKGKPISRHRRWEVHQFNKEMEDINKLLSSKAWTTKYPKK